MQNEKDRHNGPPGLVIEKYDLKYLQNEKIWLKLLAEWKNNLNYLQNEKYDLNYL